MAVAMTCFAQKGQVRVKADKPLSAKANDYQLMDKATDVPVLEFAPTTGVPSLNRGDDFEGWPTMMTHYDIQTNSMMGNRMHRFDDGSMGVTATWSQLPSYSDRGTGYNYYNGTSFLYDEYEGEPMPGRIENEKTGWPSYCQYGPEGEFVVAHAAFGSSNGRLIYYTREHKGEGEWQGPNDIPNPEDLGTSAWNMSWPRAVASGPNHDILHVVGADQDDSNTSITYTYYSRSTDGVNWTTTFIPTLEEWERTLYSADDYAVAVNGNTVAILLVSPYGHGYVIKSNDNGETWEKIKFWDNPFAGLDWETDENSLWGGDIDDRRLYGPELGTICIDNNGMVHCAFSTHMYAHDELGWTYTYYYSRTCDGIFYWNESMGTLEAPEWICPDDQYVIPSDPMNVFRMWWPTDESGDYVTRNFLNANLIGFITPDDNFADISTDNLLVGSYFQNCSTTPAICVDESGTIAVAYSSIDASRDLFMGGATSYYYRSIYVTFIEPGYVMGDATGNYSENPGNCYYEYVKLQDAAFQHLYEEAIYVTSITNTTNEEFWFAYQADEMPGIHARSGDSQTQSEVTDNIIWVQKVVPDYADVGIEETVNPMTATRIYPNPTTDVLNIEVNASQASEMSINVFNLTGQKVMEKNVTITTGINCPSISTADLSSGIYFVTLKANGFEDTMKFVVK